MSAINKSLGLFGRALAPGGKRARLSILIYHRVRPTVDSLRRDEVDSATFDWQLAILQQHFSVLPLSEAVQRLKEDRLPARAACITFDDGYADNEAIALPLLQRRGLCATFFVATSFLNGGRMWNDSIIEWVRGLEAGEIDLTELGLGVSRVSDVNSRLQLIRSIIQAVKYLEPEHRADKVAALVEKIPVTLPDDLMMTDSQVRNLYGNGMEIGGHTDTHPILASLSEDQARKEIAQGKETLEGILGTKVDLFAYPNGKPGVDYLLRDRNLVRSLGFAAAVSTHWGTSDRETDIFQLPRFTPWHRTAPKFHLALWRNYLKKPEPGLLQTG